MQRIYLVEDDENIRELVSYTLSASGFAIEAFEEGASFLARIRAELPQLVLLDIMLPGKDDGLALMSALRRDARTRGIPIILLTAKGGEMDRVRGLDLGADDYITKPFSVLELTSRVKALLRRSEVASPADLLSLSGISLSIARHLVTVDGDILQLTLKEFELLSYLLQNTGLVLTREQIMARVWGFDFEGESRTVDMHIMSLRQKLGKAGEAIQTVRGVGYRMGELP